MKDDQNKYNKILIVGLGEFYVDDFMDAVYGIIENSPDEILEYEDLPQNKIEKLNYILKHFEDKEEYERCAKIKSVQNMISKLNQTKIKNEK